MKNFKRRSAVPMVTMAQSAANWRNTHTHVDRMHSLTHLQLHQHSYYNHFVRKRQLSYYRIWNQILFDWYLREHRKLPTLNFLPQMTSQNKRE